MARKSRLTVIKEKFGGKWEYDKKDGWNCTDGRRIYKEFSCNCWLWGLKCECEPKYILVDRSGNKEVNLDDPKIYRLNGINTKKKK